MFVKYRLYIIRFVSILMSILILLTCLPIPIIVNADAVYPDGWQDWKQSDARWKKVNGRNIGSAGCFAVSIAKMYVQAGLIEDPDYTPKTFLDWACSSSNYVASDCMTNAQNIVNDYDKTVGGVKLKLKDGIYKVQCGKSKEDAVSQVVELREQGYLVIMEIAGGSIASTHFVLVGDPFVNSEGKKDVHILDVGWEHGCKDMITEDNDRYTKVNTLRVFERTDGVKIYPGETVESSSKDATSDAENTLKLTTLEQSESKTKLYNLTRYNEYQKQSLAILQNKSMTSYELAAFKWNLIASQFAVPYVSTLYDVLETDEWKKIQNDIVNVNYGTNPYLDNNSGLVNTKLKTNIEEYVKYLKDNSSKLHDVLTLLSDRNSNVYTNVYTEDKSVQATINDLYNSNVLYVQDNHTLIGSAIDTKSDKIGETNIQVENKLEDLESLVNEDLEEQTDLETESDVENETLSPIKSVDTTIKSDVELWSGLNTMYDIVLKDAKDVYSTILDKSTVQTVYMPVFISTDATTLYNNLFVSNAMELLESGGYFTHESTSQFVSDYGDKSLFIDRWGNICIESEINPSEYIIVYPAYANPLFISNEPDSSDTIGVYYETLNKQLVKYNLSFKNITGTYDYLFTLEALFIAIGQVPETENFKKLININEQGYVIANEDCKTNIKNIFVAGDNRTKGLRQLVTATSDGAVAATQAIKYINSK